jgi:anti-sigma B factor antagonist
MPIAMGGIWMPRLGRRPGRARLDSCAVCPYFSLSHRPSSIRRLLSGISAGEKRMTETIPPLSVIQEKNVRIVEFTNSKILDEQNIKEIGDTLSSLIDERENPRILIDFNSVEHLSSAALGMLINANNKVKQRNGQLRLANIRPQIYEVFVITKLNKLFKIMPTRTEAMASFM